VAHTSRALDRLRARRRRRQGPGRVSSAPDRVIFMARIRLYAGNVVNSLYVEL
jgi:hypothetical protein